MKKVILFSTLFFFGLQSTYSQPGNLDSSFGSNGIVLTDMGKSYNYVSGGKEVLLQPDGSILIIIYVSSNEGVITKRLSNGSIDSSFGSNGYSAVADFSVSKAALQEDGKIVVVGGTNSNDNVDFAIARFKADGNLDSSFSDDGKQITDFSLPNGAVSNDFANSLAVQGDGKIVVAENVGEIGNIHFAAVRYNITGSLDNTFSRDGKLTTISSNTNVSVSSVAIQSDGKIVLAGGVIQGNNYDFALIRYYSDGTLDNTFAKNGVQKTVFGSNSGAASLIIQPDGKIVAAGGAGTDFALARYNIDGNLDTTFSKDGKQTTVLGTGSLVLDIAIQGDGKIVVAGISYNSNNNSDFAVARYNGDGSLDHTFNGDGKQITDIGTSRGAGANSVIIQSDGKIVAVGEAFDESTGFFIVARYNAAGGLDKTFGADGKLRDAFRAPNTTFSSIAIQEDGKIVTLGRTWNGSDFVFAIARYNTSGGLDETFGSGGKVLGGLVIDGFGFALSLAIQKDGKIVIAAAAFINTTIGFDFGVARYNTDGSLDTTFGTSGKVITNFGYGSRPNSVAIQDDGKIIVAGSTFDGDLHFAVARYNTNGSLDSSFSNDGKQIISFSSEEGIDQNYATSVAIQSDGKIIVAGLDSITGQDGGVGPFVELVRLNIDGTLDNTFGYDGKRTFGAASFFSDCSITLQNDGKILIGSSFTLNRIEANGSDGTFLGDGALTSIISSVAVQNDGKILVGGSALIRYNTDGSIDSTFSNDGIQITPFLSDIAIKNDKLYGVGSAVDNYGYKFGKLVGYLLDNKTNTPPTVSLTDPADNATYLAPAAHIKLSAAALAADGSISKLEFYNGTTLLDTETVAPYGFVWTDVPLGNYTLTAKAYDNSGNVATSAAVHISVVPNKPPTVSIIAPENNEHYAAPAYIHFEAAASDTDGRITRVEFYSGSTLIRTEYKYPYTYVWKNLPVGTYIITAVATDNCGDQTTSTPITVRVKTPETIVSSRPSSGKDKTALTDALSIGLTPNPANSIINIYTEGLQQDKPVTLSIISVSGIVLKTMNIKGSDQIVQLDISSLASGVYTIKITNGEKVLYKQFVKL